MAYAAVISLYDTFEQLLYSSRISLVSSSPEIMRFMYKEVIFSLVSTLERLDRSSKSSSRTRVNVVDEQIREVVFKFEDVLESHVLNQIISQSEESIGDESRPLLFSIDLQNLKPEILSFTETLKKMEEEYVEAVRNPLPEEDEEEEDDDEEEEEVSSKSKMLGLFDFYSKLKDNVLVLKKTRLEVIPIVGMPGIGKTTIAKEIFEDPDILKCFDLCLWVAVGRKCPAKGIPRAILAQLNPNTDHKMLTQGDHEKIAGILKESLKGKKYLIVLDDVWDRDFWFHLHRSIPDNKNGSRVLLTTRLHQVADRGNRVTLFTMPLLNQEESWHLLCEKVFAQGLCPPALEKVGKKIADKCEGLPLTIVTVAELLRKVEKIVERWNMVAEEKDSLFADAYEEISKVLFPSYDYLPQHLKPCFLYLATFPQGYEIPTSQLFQLWIVEGFSKPPSYIVPERCCMGYLEELISNNLGVSYQKIDPWCRVRTCSLHSSFWQLCKKESRKNKFFHVLSRLADAIEEDIKSQRRLCIHNNILFGIKDVYSSLKECASTTRGLLCYGPDQQYPVPICFELRLLRVLDALTIRLYEFPIEVLELVQLRYLALMCNGKLPPSISKLWNLQFLIVRRHLSIKSCGAPSYIPMEIWDMKELKHIQIMGSDLPDTGNSSLENLSTLLNVSTHSCTKRILERISNLKKLGIRIESAPDASESLSCFDHISHMGKLESLKCAIVNPEIRSDVVAPPAPLSIFPSTLGKLSLSGMGYPWKEMRKIASLPNLKVLKLRNYAFRGPEWEIEKNVLHTLLVLLIEDTDLVQWRVGSRSLSTLKDLSIRQCYRLKEIHGEFPYLSKIEVVDCNPIAVTLAKEMGKAVYDKPAQVNVHSSWDEGNSR